MSTLPATENNLACERPNGLGAAWHHPVFTDLIAWLVLNPCPHCGFAPHDLEQVRADYAKGNEDRLRGELIFHRQILSRNEVRCNDCIQQYEVPTYLKGEIL